MRELDFKGFISSIINEILREKENLKIIKHYGGSWEDNVDSITIKDKNKEFVVKILFRRPKNRENFNIDKIMKQIMKSDEKRFINNYAIEMTLYKPRWENFPKKCNIKFLSKVFKIDMRKLINFPTFIDKNILVFFIFKETIINKNEEEISKEDIEIACKYMNKWKFYELENDFEVVKELL